jgi:hypothetical protein
MIYILIVIAVVNGGSVVTFQEFSDRDACEAARAYVQSKIRYPNLSEAACFPKQSKR